MYSLVYIFTETNGEDDIENDQTMDLSSSEVILMIRTITMTSIKIIKYVFEFSNIFTKQYFLKTYI